MEQPRNTGGQYKVGMFVESKRLLEEMKTLADAVKENPPLRLAVLREIRMLLVDIDQMDDRRKKRNALKPKTPMALMAPSHRKRIEAMIEGRQKKLEALSGIAH